ncbi:hypothetical protein ENBRE01_2352 [Enteropsectra breve]|nr:hypothetical protein ENBRE01_2352 [Enteropsectra breve]
MISQKIIAGAEKIVQTKLNSAKMIHAINEFALAPIYYYIGIIDYLPEEIEELEAGVKRVLIKNKIHAQDACKQ